MKDDCGRAGSAHVTDDSIQAAADLVTLQVAACTRIGRFYGEERQGGETQKSGSN